MLFEKVTKEHILQGITDFEEKGLPNEFGPSSTYDLVYEGKKYPPKAIMAYANYYAEGRAIGRYFKGGLDTDCFKAFDRIGFNVVKKEITAMNEKLHKLKQEFLDYWPLEKLQIMTLEEYTDTNRENSFCYWLEHITRDLGSIVGGSSYKFGVYKIGSTSKTDSATNKDNDGNYAWFTKYGNTAIEAFDKVKSLIIEIATLADSNELNPIDTIDLGDAYKWKIAFLYSDYGVVNIFKKEALRFVANTLFNEEQIPEDYGTLNSFMLSKKKDQDFFSFTKELWQHYDKNNSKAVEFKKWLKTVNKEKSNKSSSYISAINILITVFNVEVYTESDIIVLQELYEDLIAHQKDQNGKYAYEKKSYGEKGFYSAAIKSYIQFLTNGSVPIVSEEGEIYKGLMKEKLETVPLNQILYGPPGTGKTYNTINEAIAIVDPDFDQNQSREIVMKKYDELVEKGQIVFTTFHQSLSYEDFIEGIKPTLFKDEDENDAVELQYEIGDGIFKQMVNSIEDENLANKASKQSLYVPQELFEENIVKISLGNSLDSDDDNIYKYCMENNVMAIGFGEDIDFTGVTNRTDIRERFKENGMDFSNPMDFNVSAIERFVLWAKKDRLVFASHGTKFIKAIGVIDGDYYCDTKTPIRYSQFKPVKWLYKDLKLPIKEVYNKLLSQQSIYEIDSRLIKKEFFAGKPSVNSNSTNRVLIIDEINRGNVSAIFGELITLIEEDKRQNEKNALSVTLPYSKESFSVPNNLFIIGTMNTADRSVEALDTALRRRFSFIEMMPDYEVITNLSIEDISLKEVLKTINDRVELLIDRDHTIGHSYFMDISSPLELANAFNDKIAPLLQEYFYGDYGKIGLVLGEGFVKKAETKNIAFASFKYEDSEDFKTPKYSLIKVNKGNVIPAIKILLGKVDKPSED